MQAIKYYFKKEWKQSIQIFVSSNCYNFSDDLYDSSAEKKLEENSRSSHHSLKQYEIWKNFQDVVEQILNSFLQNLGGSIEKLEKALDEIISHPRSKS
jgi:L-lactate utilization protein LutB